MSAPVDLPQAATGSHNYSRLLVDINHSNYNDGIRDSDDDDDDGDGGCDDCEDYDGDDGGGYGSDSGGGDEEDDDGDDGDGGDDVGNSQKLQSAHSPRSISTSKCCNINAGS